MQMVICDDTQKDIEALKALLIAYSAQHEVIDFTDGLDLIVQLETRKIQPTIIFLDIYMPTINGVEVAKKIRHLNPKAKIIFTTSSEDHYSDAYNVFAFNYLLKPLDENRVIEVLDQFYSEYEQKETASIRINCNSTDYIVQVSDIIYMESSDKIVSIFLTTGETIRCYHKLSNLIKLLPESVFLRCHQSYIVNMEHINKYNKQILYVKDRAISISKKYSKSVKDQYYEYLFSKMGKGVI